MDTTMTTSGSLRKTLVGNLTLRTGFESLSLALAGRNHTAPSQVLNPTAKCGWRIRLEGLKSPLTQSGTIGNLFRRVARRFPTLAPGHVIRSLFRSIRLQFR